MISQLETAADPRRRLLERYPAEARSLVANLFLDAARRGVTDPVIVVGAVTAEGRRRWSRWADGKGKAIADTLVAYPTEAVDYAGWAIAWAGLPNDCRQAIKAERGHDYRLAWLSKQPATDAQVRYVRQLGWTGEIASKAAASTLIDELRSGGAA